MLGSTRQGEGAQKNMRVSAQGCHASAGLVSHIRIGGEPLVFSHSLPLRSAEACGPVRPYDTYTHTHMHARTHFPRIINNVGTRLAGMGMITRQSVSGSMKTPKKEKVTRAPEAGPLRECDGTIAHANLFQKPKCLFVLTNYCGNFLVLTPFSGGDGCSIT